jgi:8-oxo-dGTP pyrophosphatase MutT (NUDIX family)
MLKRFAGRLFLRLLITVKALWVPTAFGVSGAFFDEGGRVLLVRHRYRPGWHLPGGGVDRGEPPQAAVVRELGEEVGLTGGSAQFVSLHTQRLGFVTNVVAFYRVQGRVAFKPSLEIAEICFADPAALPPGTGAPTRRRLAEMAGAAPPSPYW